MLQNNPWFLHVDLDAFFASVEQLDHPEYRGKPVIVGGKPEDKRSVVSTASYEARKFGVHSAMPTAQAYKLCPQGIYVHGRMDRYAELSCKIMDIFREFSPDVDQMSIDEAFIDLTGTENLFGPPEETAFKIKKQVKEYTGLTVSVGLATNKYLAKIASAMSKPDGFYFIKPGEEESFMLNLPLDKVWGVGKKTLETIKKSGLNSTRDIYSQNIDVLKFMYGNSMGAFLYNAVRGIDTVGFGKKSKTHSISSETTFIEDISDLYTLETKLLELCHGVLFRLLKENSYSRTVMVKIRYADFTTVSIQKTVDYNILTLDDMFTLIKQIFNEKYDHKTGIRLIGVGLENIEKQPLPEQLYLFNENDEKKRSVEKAILNMEQKHPDIKIHKARLLFNDIKNTAKILLVFLLLFNFSSLLKAEENNTTDSLGAAGLLPDTIDTASEESSEDESLFEWELPAKSIKYELSGYWAAEFTGGLNSTFGNNTNFALSAGTPVFKQEINLSALFNITDFWYFDLEFADKFAKNTYSFGYNKKDDYIQSFLLSNRNITFPSYSSELNGFSLAGGENQAPGITMHFNDAAKNKWSADLMLRYDLTSQKDATFYGKNVVNDRNINLSDYLSGKMFIIPDSEILTKIKNLYIENSKGTFIDKNGRKFKKLSESQYKIISSKNLLVLSNDISNQKYEGKQPEIIVTFQSDSDFFNLINNIGSYDDKTSYLGKIQEFFNSDNSFEINLKDFSYPFSTEIETLPALILQSNQGFSPFLFCGIYDCGIISEGEAAVISYASEQIIKDYYADVSDDIFNFTAENFFFENHKYIQTGHYDNKSSDFTAPSQRYPFADKNPFIYLKADSNSDYVLRLRNYSEIQNFDIGKKAAGGSVKVYINGILDAGAKYENSSGFVVLSKNVTESDKIFITWNEESENIQNGAGVFAAGYKYNFTPYLNTDLSLTTFIPFYPGVNYKDSDSSLTSFAAITGGINFEKNNLKIQDALSIALMNDNISGKFLANFQQEQASQTYYLSYSNGYPTHSVPSLNITAAPLLSAENNFTVYNTAGTGDKDITGYKIPLQWDFSTASSENKNWASVDLKLNSGNLLCKSSEFEIAIKPESLIENVDVYLQLGIKAEKSFSGETSCTISTWKITGNDDARVISNLLLDTNQWQTVRISLSDSDKAKLISNYDLRLIVVSKDADATSKGILYLGPYEPIISGAYVQNTDALILNSSVVLINDSPSSKEFFNNDNQGTKISWTNINHYSSKKDYIITTQNFFKECDFSSYKNIVFDLYFSTDVVFPASESSEDGLTFVLDNPEITGSNTALELKLSSEYLSSIFKNQGWYSFNIDKTTKTLTVNNSFVPEKDYSLKITQLIKPVRQSIKINTLLDSEIYENGYFIIGNLYFNNNEPYFTAKNNLKVDYNKEELGFIKNLNINLSSQQNAILNFNETQNNSSSIDGTFNIDFSIWNFDLQASAGINSSTLTNNPTILSNSNHKIKTNEPLFNVISLIDEYSYNTSAKESDNKFNLGLDFSSLNFPLRFNFLSSAKNSFNYLSQNLNSNILFDFNIFETSLNFNLSTIFSQKIDCKNDSDSDVSSFFSDMAKAYALEFSVGNEKAYNRNEIISSSLIIKTPVKDLSPSLKFDLNGDYLNKNERLYSDKVNLYINIPFSISSNKFSFNISKSAGGISPSHGSDYFTDCSQLFESQTKRQWFYTSIPFYDLFSSSLYNNFKDTSSLNSFYSTKYELNWKRNLSNSITDLLVPVNSSITISRDISKSDNISDLYQIKLTSGNAFINLLGSKGKVKLFNNFTQDEFNGFLSGIIKIPADEPENTIMQLSWYGSLLLFVDSQNSVKAGTDFTLDTKGDWNFRTTGIWTHKGKDTILLEIPKLFFKDLNLKDTKITRKESLNFTLSQSDIEFSQLYQLLHDCDIQIKKNYNFTTGIGLNLKITENSATNLAAEFKIGGKIEF